MNKYAGKVRIGAQAILSATAFVILAAAAVSVPTTISVPDSLDFPGSPVGDTLTRILTVTNTGKTQPLIIGSVTSSAPAEFAVGTSTCPSGGSGLAPGLSCTIAISFTPHDLDARRATLKISDNAPASPQSVALSGSGMVTMAVSPTSYAFRDTQVGSKATKELTVQNFQTKPVSLTESFGGANAHDFSVTGGTCTATLAAKSDCSLVVTFAPTAAGTDLAFITVTAVPDPLGPYTVTFGAMVTAAATPEPTP